MAIFHIVKSTGIVDDFVPDFSNLMLRVARLRDLKLGETSRGGNQTALDFWNVFCLGLADACHLRPVSSPRMKLEAKDRRVRARGQTFQGSGCESFVLPLNCDQCRAADLLAFASAAPGLDLFGE